MASTAQTGHAKNVANHNSLILKVTNLGGKYNPSNKDILLPALTEKQNAASAVLKSISSLYGPWALAVDARELIFSPLGPFFTRVFRSISSSGLSKLFVADVKPIILKLQGRRAKPKKLPPQTADGSTPEIPEHKNISVSQLDFDSRIDNTEKLVELLKAQPDFKPNEHELSTDSLQHLLDDMRTTNNAVLTAYNPLNTARNNRDVILYDDATGLIHQAAEVKSYVLSVFGASSPEYKDINKLRFKTIKKK